MTTSRTCSVCGKGFEPRFRFQTEEHEGGARHYCSPPCQQRGGTPGDTASTQAGVECSACGRAFGLEFAYQMVVTDEGRRYFCSESCRTQGAPAPRRTRGPRRIAVFNHKGGTGKTTTAINV